MRIALQHLFIFPPWRVFLILFFGWSISACTRGVSGDFSKSTDAAGITSAENTVVSNLGNPQDGRLQPPGPVGTPKQSFYIEVLSLARPEIVEFDALGMPESKNFIMSACLAKSENKQRMPNEAIEIRNNQKTMSLVTDQGGCFQWPEVLTLDFYAPEKYYEIERYIKVINLKQELTFRYFLNPWADAVVFNPTQVLNNQAPAALPPEAVTAKLTEASKTPKNIPPKDLAYLRTSGLEIKFISHSPKDYEVDSYLNLKMAHLYSLEISPSLQRRGINEISGYKTHSLERGRLKLTVMFFRNDENNPQPLFKNYITHLETFIELDQQTSGARTRAIIKFPDVSLLATRMKIYVQIEAPQISSPYLASGRYEGTLDSISSGIKLFNSNYGAIALLKSYLPQIQEPIGKVSPIALFKKTSPFVAVANEIDTKKNTVKQNIFQCQLARSTDKIPLELINKALFNKSLSACEKQILRQKLSQLIQRKFKPSKSSYVPEFTFQSRPFVQSLTSKVPQLRTQIPDRPEILTLSAALSESKSSTLSFGASATANASVGFDAITLTRLTGALTGVAGVSPSAGFNLGMNGGWSYATSQTQSTNVSATKSFSLTSQPRTFHISARTQRCLMVGVKWSQLIPTGSGYSTRVPIKDQRLVKGFYFCQNSSQIETLAETYYLIQDDSGSNNAAWVDSNSMNQKAWLMFVRGRDKYGLFRDLIKSNNIQISLTKPNVTANLNLIEKSAVDRITQSFPGMGSETLVWK